MKANQEGTFFDKVFDILGFTTDVEPPVIGDRKLLHEAITHYKKIVIALSETIRLVEEIDNTIPK